MDEEEKCTYFHPHNVIKFSQEIRRATRQQQTKVKRMQHPVHRQQVHSHLHKKPIFYLIHCFTAASVTFCCCEPIEIQLLGLLAVTLDDLQVPHGFCNDGRFSHLLQVQRTALQAFLYSRPGSAGVKHSQARWHDMGLTHNRCQPSHQ